MCRSLCNTQYIVAQMPSSEVTTYSQACKVGCIECTKAIKKLSHRFPSLL